MSLVSILPILRVSEGLGSLMSHYAMLYCIQKDTNLIACYIKDHYSNNSAMYSFNKLSLSSNKLIDLDDAFPNISTIFDIINHNDIAKKQWHKKNFIGESYETIINFCNSLNIDTNIVCHWDVTYSVLKKYLSEIINVLYIFDNNIINYCSSIIKPNSTAVCIRNEYKKIGCPHTILDIDYYDAAFEILKDNSETFSIFSDDIDESKKMLRPIETKYNIEYKSIQSSAVGLCAMSLCDNIINANSSFSFWASILNKHKNNKIICPTLFINPKKDPRTAELLNNKWYPEHWIGIDP